MVDYLIDVKSIFDSFAKVRFPISDDDFMEYVTNSLGPRVIIFYHFTAFLTDHHHLDELCDLLFCEKHL